MKKLLSSTVLIMGLLAGTPAHAAGLPVMDSISNLFDGISAGVDEAMETVTKKWQAFMKTNAGQSLEKLGDSLDKLNDIHTQAQQLHNKAMSYINDPTGSAITAVGLDPKKTEQIQYLPDGYRDDQVKDFKAGKGSSDITASAQKTFDQIKQGSDDLFTLTDGMKGDYEKAMPDRDQREAAYYLAMSEEAYKQASLRYDGISKDYKSKIENARDAKEKENLQMHLQSEQLMLQSQLIQLTALKQTHEARREVADARKQELQKMKKDMRRVSVLP